jgi:hypothetical protein
MHISQRALAGALALALVATACSGHSTLPGVGTQSGSGDGTQSISQIPGLTNAPMISVPQLHGRLAFTDIGRRSPSSPVSVAITLNYNHQAQLDQLIESQSGPNGTHQFLTPEQFNSYYAPTAQQEQAVVSALQSAGFTITNRYPNRTVVDATAPSATVERFFNTQMHSVSQGRYGQRFANLVPATVPATIASYVRTASLSNVVIAETQVQQEGGDRRPLGLRSRKPAGGAPGQEASAAYRTMASGCSGQLLLNPGFESGNRNWGTTRGVITKDAANAYQGNWFAWLDGYTSPETDTLSQTVSIPAGCTATLTYYLYIASSEPNSAIDTLKLTANGTAEQSFSNVNQTGGVYVAQSVNLSAFAGKSTKILWTSRQNGSNETDFFVDSTALTLGSGTPTPTPPPTPTPKPTPTPTGGPTPTPTPHATPTPTPTPTPVPTPTPGSGCTGTAAENGPLSNSSGTLATGVAKPFDFPVQHGCNGAGYTAAIVIDDPVNTSYVASYLSAAQVTQTGTITNEAVDGGGSGDDPETDLDVQTISGLAPGANIIVYDEGTLSDQAIEDAYNKVLSDAKASAVNSSFGGCESSDPSFESATNAIAQQGAAEGVEFSASSGDSGSDECGSNNNAEGVSAPAGDPYFTSIGGVNFAYDGSGVLTSVTAGSAACGSSSGMCYGGGGVSTVVAIPTWQSGIAGMISSGRNQPDISLPFDPVAVYTGGSFASYLGTSWSSPASVALFIETDELHGTKLGWLNSSLYSLFKSTGYASYYTPCTSGNNIAYSCNASQYNQAAGIGTPKGWALANAL